MVELDRAARATDLVEHGLDALLAHRGHRELEAQTSLKRAALNLRNARGAVGAHRRPGRRGRGRPTCRAARPDGRERCRSGPRRPIGPDAAEVDDEGVRHPRM